MSSPAPWLRIYFDHEISVEQRAEWVTLYPGQRRPVPVGAPRIGIAIGEFAAGPEWFSIAEG